MIILGLFDKINNSYDKFFMIRKDEFNNFMKSLKIIVNNGEFLLCICLHYVNVFVYGGSGALHDSCHLCNGQQLVLVTVIELEEL